MGLGIDANEPQTGRLTVERDGTTLVLRAEGAWRVDELAALDRTAAGIDPAGMARARIDVSRIDWLDTSGAWLLQRTRLALAARGLSAEFAGAKPDHAALLERIDGLAMAGEVVRRPGSAFIAMLERMGGSVFDAAEEGRNLLNFLGVTTVTGFRALLRPHRHVRPIALVSHLERAGLDAMPIVGLLSFLIGVVIAYQGADQLRRFGAEIFTVNLLGVSILREMGILLTAIVIAGRTGSAFTAEIGTMQVNEEVDAMRTIGVDPIEALVLPRVLALMIALPLLTVFADLMGLAGGALMALVVLDISFVQFLERINTVVPIASFYVGMVKAPVFGLLIGLVGCRHGLRVSGGAESVGLETTRSVVVSIFLVIVADAGFSIVFSYLRI